MSKFIKVDKCRDCPNNELHDLSGNEWGKAIGLLLGMMLFYILVRFVLTYC